MEIKLCLSLLPVLRCPKSTFVIITVYFILMGDKGADEYD